MCLLVLFAICRVTDLRASSVTAVNSSHGQHLQGTDGNLDTALAVTVFLVCSDLSVTGTATLRAVVRAEYQAALAHWDRPPPSLT